MATIKDIAKEKAGIIKKGRPVVVGIQKYPVYPIFEETAKIRNSDLYKAEDLCNYSILKMDENGSLFDTNIDYIWLYGVASTTGGTAWMVGERGSVFKSTDNGKGWQTIQY